MKVYSPPSTCIAREDKVTRLRSRHAESIDNRVNGTKNSNKKIDVVLLRSIIFICSPRVGRSIPINNDSYCQRKYCRTETTSSLSGHSVEILSRTVLGGSEEPRRYSIEINKLDSNIGIYVSSRDLQR